MKQSSFIVAALLAAFVLFIAARGRLPLYASVLWGPKPADTSAPSSGGGSLPMGDSGGSDGWFEMPDFLEDVDFGDVAKVAAFFV